jgi:hypothetical protein
MCIQSRARKRVCRFTANPRRSGLFFETSVAFSIRKITRIASGVARESRAGRRRPRTLNAHDGARQRFLLALPRGAQGGRPRLQEGRRRVRAARRPRLRRARRVRGGGEAEQKGPRHSGTKRASDGARRARTDVASARFRRHARARARTALGSRRVASRRAERARSTGHVPKPSYTAFLLRLFFREDR